MSGKPELRRINHQLSHADMGLIGLLIFPGEGIGKVRVEQHMDPLPLQQEPALSQPPQSETAVATIRRMNIAKQRIVGAERTNHDSPSSLRTIATPLTMLASFCRAAQRAVWLRPQSGAKERRSAGACFRHKRTRSATSAGVSM